MQAVYRPALFTYLKAMQFLPRIHKALHYYFMPYVQEKNYKEMKEKYIYGLTSPCLNGVIAPLATAIRNNVSVACIDKHTEITHRLFLRKVIQLMKIYFNLYHERFISY